MPRVVHIDKIAGLSDAYVAGLRDKGIRNLDDLWSGVGSDFDAGIKQVSAATKVPEEVITALLIADGLGKVKIKNRRLAYFQNPRTYAGLVVVALIGYALYLLAFRADLPQQVVVINPKGIAAYQVIGNDDVAFRRVPFRRAQTLSDLGTAVGGYALTKLEPDAPIRSNQILPSQTARGLNNAYIISVPVKANSLVLAPKPGAKLSLLPLPEQSKDKPQPPTATIEAVLLGIEQRDGATTLVVAVAKNIENVNALMGGATIVSVAP